jgi:hypothetical protein
LSSSSSTPPQFHTLLDTDVEEVELVIRRLPDKSSAVDPMPTSVLKSISDLVSPFIVHLFNLSVSQGRFPSSFKQAFITPIVKKVGLDPEDVKSYRPISNLPVLSKLMERLFARRLSDYLKSAGLLPSLQSGFRPLHSTETAVLKVLSDLLDAIDRGDIGVLVLLDLSAAFHTVDHEILLQRLERTFRISGAALRWLASYLSDREQFVRLGSDSSRVVRPPSGVPQGSVLGPLLFIMYTVDLIGIIQSQGLQPHLYADDTQLYGSCRPQSTSTLAERVVHCVDVVAGWMRSNRLQLNADKTECLWVASSRRQHQLPTSPLTVDGSVVYPVRSVRNLGIFLDADLIMRSHVARTVSRCFAVLRQLRQVRRSLPSEPFRMLISALVLTRLDYANSVLVGLPAYLVNRLQSVLNASARLFYGLRRYDHVTNALITLHWLKIPERIKFKLAVLVHRSLHGAAPDYIGPLQRVADLPGRRALRSASTNQLFVPSTRLTVGARSFRVAGPSVWNSLPADLTSTDSLPVFRRRLKTYLFEQSYNGLII